MKTHFSKAYQKAFTFDSYFDVIEVGTIDPHQWLIPQKGADVDTDAVEYLRAIAIYAMEDALGKSPTEAQAFDWFVAEFDFAIDAGDIMVGPSGRCFLIGNDIYGKARARANTLGAVSTQSTTATSYNPYSTMTGPTTASPFPLAIDSDKTPVPLAYDPEPLPTAAEIDRAIAAVAQKHQPPQPQRAYPCYCCGAQPVAVPGGFCSVCTDTHLRSGHEN